MDNTKNSVGCRSGKTILVDPNKFENQGFYDNMSVPLEDLNIYVQLETTKRARTVLTDNGITISQNTKGVKVFFIEGTDVSGKKVLTTKYTDLTTSFENTEESVDNESLGITGINIDFDSSYAPKIVINFVDLRGSSVFQNESMLKGSNKYATLFQLPYPIFTLTVKGYYGLPVSYDLHMTKFNAKFNSKTGNFEITAEFIGYTYALLSDMLIGYLRAIEHTSLGAKKYKELKEENPNLLTLDELITAVSNIDKNLEKLASNDPILISYNIYNTQIEKLGFIKDDITSLGSELDVLNDLSEYRYIRPRNINVDEFNSIVKPYNEQVKSSVENFNNGSDILFDSESFNFSNAKLYLNLNLELLRDDTKREELRNNQLRGVENTDELIASLIEYASKNNIVGDFNVYDLNDFYKKLSDKETELDEKIKEYRSEVGKKLRDKIKQTLAVNDGLGLDPTIRNVVDIFTTSVEVFLYVLFSVSSDAIKSDVRAKELSRFVPNEDFDYKKKESTDSSSASGALTQVYYPWPEYRKNDDKLGLIEDYLGNAKGLNKFNVTELNFIDDLHKAFIQSSTVLDEAKIIEDKNTSTWVSTNPLDTPLFISDYPYSRFDKSDKNTVLSVLLTRALTYLGVSNYKLRPDEIQKFANAESALLLNDIDSSLKRVITSNSFGKEDILKTKAKINDVETDIVKNSDGNYVYNFMYGGEGKPTGIIPLNKPVNTSGSKKFEFNLDSTRDSLNGYFNEGGVFISNYTTSSAYDDLNSETFNNSLLNNEIITNQLNDKKLDGSTYLKVFFPNSFNQNIPNSLQSGLEVTDNVLTLENLSKPLNEFRNTYSTTDVGFNQFGGSYGIQEYNFLNFGVETLEKAPFRLMFFSNAPENNLLQGVFTGVRTRDNNGNFKTSKYDFNNKSGYAISDDYREELDDNTFEPKNLRGSELPIGENRLLLNQHILTNSFDIAFPYVSFVVHDDSPESKNIGLFGSRLYYEQTSEEAKAFLFLHTLPWNGLTKNFFYGGLFSNNEVINTFANRAGFISVPYLWAAFIGGIIWRMESTDDPLIFHDGIESFIPTLSVDEPEHFPNKNQYLCVASTASQELSNNMVFMRTGASPLASNVYKTIDEVIVQLPRQVKDEFLNVFDLFVNSIDGNSDWEFIKDSLEIFSGNGTEWKENWLNVFSEPSNAITNGDGSIVINNDAIRSYLNSSVSNYNIITSYNPFDDFRYNFFTEIKDYSKGAFDIMTYIKSEIILSNTTYRIWDVEKINTNFNLTDETSNIFVSSQDMDIFMDQLVKNLKDSAVSEASEINQKENEIFGTDNDILIKQLLYRTCKNIYDKWLGNANNEESLIFRGGLTKRNGIDFELAKKRGVKTPKLIDSFRFVNRSFADIGNDLYVNPKQVVDSLINNPNISFYDLVTSLLSTNKFNFIALPNYINYKDEDSLKNIFKPLSGVESFSDGATGPAFVCVYAGQPSKHLDFKDSEYENDGIDFRCNNDNNLMPSLAKDFFVNDNEKPYENNVAVFAVNYSQQNQNIFKDITLDQTEFTETAESLQITNEIANKGAENRITLGGQNMYDVYSVRSYSTEIEMLGNAMIQPMMYFQLNNIPMFHGAYMIIKVNHSIKPNHMLTTFKGVRIKSVETPLLDAADLYMPLLESVNISDNSTQKTTSIVDLPDSEIAGVFADPFENDKTNVLVTSAPGLRNLSGSVNVHKGVDYALPQGTNLTSIYDGVIENLKFNYGDDGRGYGLYIVINHGIIADRVYKTVYGHVSDLDKTTFGFDLSNLSQDKISEILKGYNPNITVKKGQVIGKSGGVKGKSYLDATNKKYDTAGGSTGGHLHHELRIGETNQADVSVFQLSYVNGIPYLPLNAYAKYKEGIKSPDDEIITQGNNADYWSLIAICSLEAGVPQARADVAQSIYNRLATPGKPYGKTIKSIICANNQYQPTFNNRADWLVINDSNTAITAVKNAKNWSLEQATNAISQTVLAINDETLKQNSRNFVDSRTEFLANTPTSSKAIEPVQRTPFNENNSFFWRYAGKKLKGKPTPIPINWVNSEGVSLYVS